MWRGQNLNSPVASAALAPDVFRLLGSALHSGSCGASSLWVLESRLGPLGTTLCWGRSAVAPVWSSERLFATNKTKRRRLHYSLTSTFTSSHDYSGSDYSGVRADLHSSLKTSCLFEGHKSTVSRSLFCFRKCTFCLETQTSLPAVT